MSSHQQASARLAKTAGAAEDKSNHSDAVAHVGEMPVLVVAVTDSAQVVDKAQVKYAITTAVDTAQWALVVVGVLLVVAAKAHTQPPEQDKQPVQAEASVPLAQVAVAVVAKAQVVAVKVDAAAHHADVADRI